MTTAAPTCQSCFTKQILSPDDPFVPDRCDSSVSSESDEEESRNAFQCSWCCRPPMKTGERDRTVTEDSATVAIVLTQQATAWSSSSSLARGNDFMQHYESTNSCSSTSPSSSLSSQASASFARSVTQCADSRKQTTLCKHAEDEEGLSVSTSSSAIIVPEEITCRRSNRKSVRFVVQTCSETTAAAGTQRDTSSMHTISKRKAASHRDLWWTPTELKQIRRFCQYIVSEYRLHDGEDLIMAYLKLQKRSLSSDEFRRCRKMLSESYDDTRGLEHFVARAATELQHRRYIETVMDAQKHAKREDNAIDIVAKAAQKASLPSRQVAQRLAICDYHAAMHVHLEATSSNREEMNS